MVNSTKQSSEGEGGSQFAKALFKLASPISFRSSVFVVLGWILRWVCIVFAGHLWFLLFGVNYGFLYFAWCVSFGVVFNEEFTKSLRLNQDFMNMFSWCNHLANRPLPFFFFKENLINMPSFLFFLNSSLLLSFPASSLLIFSLLLTSLLSIPLLLSSYLLSSSLGFCAHRQAYLLQRVGQLSYNTLHFALRLFMSNVITPLLGLSPHKNCKNDLDDQTWRELE